MIGETSAKGGAAAGPGAVRHLVIGVVVILFAAAVALGVDRYGKGTRRTGAVAPIDAAPRVVLVDAPQEAYRFWKGEGYHGRTVLYVADGWERINPGDYDENEMRRSYPLKIYRLADHFEERFLDSRNFLYAAALQGISRRIVAVLSPAGFEVARVHARHAKNARLSGDVLYETHQGFPRWFTTVEGLPRQEEPCLLYVAASIFRSVRPADLLAALKSRGVRCDAVVLCAQAGDPSVRDDERRALAEFASLLKRGRV